MNPALVKLQADNSLLRLKNNPYPGRGLVVGLNKTSTHILQLYWIMGRSENSRNRIFEFTDGKLFTKPADLTKIQDPSLIIYDAMLEIPHFPVEGGRKIKKFAVSNGKQTEDILKYGITSTEFREYWQYEPDAPNFTPRINGMVYWEKLLKEKQVRYRVEMSILTKDPFSAECNHRIYSYGHLEPGIGYCLTTYRGEPVNEGVPLPPFEGGPSPFLLNGTPAEILNEVWQYLNVENVVSFAVKSIHLFTGESEIQCINKY